MPCGIAKIPCGGGKTAVSAAIACHLGRRTLFTVDQENFLMKTYRTLRALVPDARIGVIHRDRFEIEGCDFVVALIQTVICREYRSKDLSSFGLWIHDEMHGIAAPSYSRLARVIPSRARLGLSATPVRHDRPSTVLRWLMGPVIVDVEREPMKPGEGEAVMLVYRDGDERDLAAPKPGTLGRRNNPAAKPIMVSRMATDKKRTIAAARRISQALLSPHPIQGAARHILVLSERLDQLADAERITVAFLRKSLAGWVSGRFGFDAHDIARAEEDARKKISERALSHQDRLSSIQNKINDATASLASNKKKASLVSGKIARLAKNPFSNAGVVISDPGNMEDSNGDEDCIEKDIKKDRFLQRERDAIEQSVSLRSERLVLDQLLESLCHQTEDLIQGELEFTCYREGRYPLKTSEPKKPVKKKARKDDLAHDNDDNNDPGSRLPVDKKPMTAFGVWAEPRHDMPGITRILFRNPMDPDAWAKPPSVLMKLGRIIGGQNQREQYESENCDAIFASIGIANKNLDIPRLDTVFFLTPCAKLEQPVGRALREFLGKNAILIVYLCDMFGLFEILVHCATKYLSDQGFGIRWDEAYADSPRCVVQQQRHLQQQQQPVPERLAVACKTKTPISQNEKTGASAACLLGFT